MSSKTHQTYSANPEAMSATVGEEAVLLVPSSGIYYGLNAVAARAWQLMEGGATLEVLVDALEREFDVSRETLERDMVDLLTRFKELNLVTVQSAP